MYTIDLNIIKKQAAHKHDDFEVMRYMLEKMTHLSDETLDTIVDAIAQPIINAIDCTQCGNCCRMLDVYLTEADADRLESRDHIVSAEAVEEWGRFAQKPCPYFDGRLCTVYERRPESCRAYPVFTPDFRWTLAETIEGAALCPIIYHVLAAMVEKTDELSRAD